MSIHQLWSHRTRARKSLNHGTKGIGACRPRRLGVEVLEQRRLLSIGAGVEPFVGPVEPPEQVGVGNPAAAIEPAEKVPGVNIDWNLTYLSQQYEAFIAGGGQPEDFVLPPNMSHLRISGNRVAVSVCTVEPVAQEYFDEYGDLMREVNSPLIEELRDLGLELPPLSDFAHLPDPGQRAPGRVLDVIWEINSPLLDHLKSLGMEVDVQSDITTGGMLPFDRIDDMAARGDIIRSMRTVSFVTHDPTAPGWTTHPPKIPGIYDNVGPDLVLPPWSFIELPNGRNLCGIVGSNLARLHYDYEAYLVAGGEAADFVPSDPDLPLSGDRVSVSIVARDFVKREEVDQYGDVIETINWDFIHDLEAAGLEVGALGPYSLDGFLPFYAVDDVAMVPDVGSVWAMKPVFFPDLDSGATLQRGPDLQLPPWASLKLSDGTDLCGKVTSNLAQLYHQYQSFIDSGGSKTEFVPNVPDLRVSGDRVPVDIVTPVRLKWEEVDQYGDTAEIINWAFIEKLEAAGLEVAAVSEHSLGAFLPFDAIDDVAVLDGVGTIWAMTPVTWVGDTTTQGDEAQRSDEVRSSSGLDASGVSVGVLSNSYDQDEGALTDAADDVASGDLPNQVTVLQDWDNAAATDEGRAMLQIVHDVAPQASLLFHSAAISPSDFAEGISELAIAGADIIVDDALWPNEPMFVDGKVAQAVNEVVDDGVVYVSAAGNCANHSYESAFDDSGIMFFSGTKYEGTAHDFDPSVGTDCFQEFTLAPGAQIYLSFQWDERVMSATGVGSTSDLDVYVVNEACTQVLAQSRGDNINDDPIELLDYTNPSGVTNTYNLLITHRSGAGEAPGLMKYVDLRSADFTEYVTNSPTLYGHANAAGAIAVGAAFYYDTPEFGTSPPEPEDSTALGGVEILFDTDGNRLQSAEDRHKPDVVGPDGGNNTFFGEDIVGFGDTDTYPNFFGTSAAAPHVAGLAALMLQAAPAATPPGICKALESTAVNMEAAGFDYLTGYGLVDAVEAIDEIMGRFPNFDADDDPAGENADDDEPDTFEISRVGDYLRVKINGTALDLISIDDIGGISITGSGDDDTVTVYALGTDFDDGDDYANVVVLGQTGDDEAHLYDSTGDDAYRANCGSAHLVTETAYRVEADGFESTYGYATGGGTDTAKLFDTQYDDVFDADPAEAVLYRTGLFHSEVEGFDLVHAYHTTGNDEANLTGSNTIDDTFYSTWQGTNKHASLSGTGYYLRAKDFIDVYASGGGGGADVAEFHDSEGNDIFSAGPDWGNLVAGGITGFLHDVDDFPTIRAYADGGGYDKAKLFDSNGNDYFVGTATSGEVYCAGVFSNKAYSFDEVHAYADGGGYDIAKLFDTSGDDVFDANPTQGALYRSGVFYVRAKTFEQVHAYATSGGIDTAHLAGSSGDDFFASNRYSMIQGELWGTGFFNRAKQFEKVWVDLSQGGADDVELRDSSGDDDLQARFTYVVLSNAAWFYHIGGLGGWNDLVTPYSSEGDDTDDIGDPLYYTLDLTYWNP